MAAEAQRIEAALPQGRAPRRARRARRRALTTAQLAERLRAWHGDGRDVALADRRPRRARRRAEGQRRRDAAPVGPDLAACLRARAARRGAVPRLVGDAPAIRTTANDAATWLPQTSSTSPRRARAGAQLLEQIGVRHELLLADADEDAEALEAERARRVAGRLRASASRAPSCAAARRRLRARGLPDGADPVRRHHGRARPAHPRQAGRRRRRARDAARCCRAARTAC